MLPIEERRVPAEPFNRAIIIVTRSAMFIVHVVQLPLARRRDHAIESKVTKDRLLSATIKR